MSGPRENETKMDNQSKQKGLNYLAALFRQKCPRCREGSLFMDKNPYHLKTLFHMHENCPVCGQPTELEPGFYYGTAYVSYSLTVAFSASTLVAFWVLIGLSTSDNRFFWWLSMNGVLMILLQPYFMRLSRVVWLSFFVRYNKNWRIDMEITPAPAT
jgi:hypothetical protein